MLQSSNPALSNSPFQTAAQSAVGGETMTAQGAFSKTWLLFGLLLITATINWYLVAESHMGPAVALGAGGLVVGLVCGLFIFFKPNAAPVAAPIYALAQGFFLGGISAFINGAMVNGKIDPATGQVMASPYAGIVPAAVGITFGVFALMLGLYKLHIIRPTKMFVSIMTVAIGSVALIYIANLLLYLFLGSGIPFIHGSGVIGIGFSVVVVTIAALSLILDFGLIESGEAEGAPKYMEWYGAYALMVSLVWLYIEILRLLMKLRNR
jgi:uncharacterized YccA/Bax inhibitor family protein